MDEEIERHLFERWIKQHRGIPPVARLDRMGIGEYLDRTIQYAWDAWKARAEIA